MPTAEPTGGLRERIYREIVLTEAVSASGASHITDALLSGPLAPLLARLEPVTHNHTRFRNVDGGPWSPCPVSCPAAGLLR